MGIVINRACCQVVRRQISTVTYSGKVSILSLFSSKIALSSHFETRRLYPNADVMSIDMRSDFSLPSLSESPRPD